MKQQLRYKKLQHITYKNYKSRPRESSKKFQIRTNFLPENFVANVFFSSCNMINNFFVSQSSSVFLLSPSWKFFLQVQNLPPKILEYFYLPSKKIEGSTNLRGSDKCKNLLDKFLRKSNKI